VAVHDPLQSAVHLVLQAAVVGTLTHCVVHLSLQQAPHDAEHSAIADADDVVVVVVVDASGVPVGATVASETAPPSSVTPPSESPAPPVVVVVEVEPEADAEQETLHPVSHRWLQSVVQSNIAGLVEHWLVQLVSQLDVQSAAAAAVHLELHDCSSCAAHDLMHTVGAHCVEQLLLVTSWQLALASMSMLPHSLIVAARASYASAVSAANGIEANA
jgi:hypothetical protein